MLRLLVILPLLLTASCVSLSPDEVSDPSKVTLEDALGSVGAGLKNLLDNRGDKPWGLIPAEVTVSFKVAASAADGRELVVDFSANAPDSDAVSASASTNGKGTASSTGLRENTVTIRFLNVLMIPRDTLGYEKPEEIASVLDALDDTLMIASLPQNSIYQDLDTMQG